MCLYLGVLFKVVFDIGILFESSPKDMVIDFRKRGSEGEREREGEKRWSAASHMPQLGAEPATQACALTSNRTHGLLVLR